MQRKEKKAMRRQGKRQTVWETCPLTICHWAWPSHLKSKFLYTSIFTFLQKKTKKKKFLYSVCYQTTSSGFDWICFVSRSVEFGITFGLSKLYLINTVIFWLSDRLFLLIYFRWAKITCCSIFFHFLPYQKWISHIF